MYMYTCIHVYIYVYIHISGYIYLAVLDRENVFFMYFLLSTFLIIG